MRSLSLSTSAITKCVQRLALASAFLLLAPGCGAAGDDEPPDDAHQARAMPAEEPSGRRVLSEEILQTPKGTFRLVQVIDADGDISSQFTDDNGNPVDHAHVASTGTTSLVSDGLTALLKRPIALHATVDCAISLRDEIDQEWEQVHGHVDHINDNAMLNGRQATIYDLRAAADRKSERLQEAREARRELRARILRELSDREGWRLPEGQVRQLADSNESIIRPIRVMDLEDFVARNEDLIAGMDLHHEATEDSLATAMASTQVNPGAHSVGHLGAGIGIYMTETSCAPDGYLADYTRISGTDSDRPRNVASILRAVAPAAHIYCAGGSRAPTSTELEGPGPGGNPKILIVTQSASTKVSTDYDLTDQSRDNFIYDNAVLAFNSAANEGNTTGLVGSPGKAINVLTVGNYFDSIDGVMGSSSWLDPTNTKNAKPELSGPGAYINAGDWNGAPIVMSGTSQATPRVAAIAADMLGQAPAYRLRPYLLKAAMMAGALRPIAGGYDRAGLGGPLYMYTATPGAEYFWEGNNGDFQTWADQDGLPGNGSVDVQFEVTTAMERVRVVLVYLTRGTWTYAHRTDTFPLGRNLDLGVYAPNGSLVQASTSPYEAFEVVEFEAKTKGWYTARIFDQRNDDTLANLHMGLVMKYLPKKKYKP